MSRAKAVEPKVLDALKNYPWTRENDRDLILYVYRVFYDVGINDRFTAVMMRKDLPSFESIRRARQKLQAKYPELRATDKVEAIRSAEQEDYRKYAKGE